MNKIRIPEVKIFLKISVIVLIILTTSLIGLGFIESVAVHSHQKSMPVYNWIVSEDLGVGEVPNHHPAQRFRLRNDFGWDLLAYCLDEGLPPPPIGTQCERIEDDTFWCGDQYQPLLVYELVETPVPTPSETPTFTETPTITPSSTPTPTKIPTQEATQTPTERVRMGGQGNLRSSDIVRVFFGVLMIGFGISLGIFEWKHQKIPKRQ